MDAEPNLEPDEHAEISPHLCANCGGTMMYPVDWWPEGTTHWHVFLRCPDCERPEELTLAQVDASRFDRDLARSWRMVVSSLDELLAADGQQISAKVSMLAGGAQA
jgi:hypothetical protein